jgi:hypothetical protein
LNSANHALGFVSEIGPASAIIGCLSLQQQRHVIHGVGIALCCRPLKPDECDRQRSDVNDKEKEKMNANK